ncbi:MAG: DUF4215 domain-containing protein, partial [Myxococcales bacterium]|nr:DUF4215 domain-containing protein [Myxococcales bacterium]
MRHLALGLSIMTLACTYDSQGLGTGTGSGPPAADEAGTASDGSGTASTSGAAPTGGADSSSDGSDRGDETTASGTETGASQDCGNGVVDPDELCDDANGDELDGCTSTCEPGPTGLVFGAIEPLEGSVGGWTVETFDEISDCAPNEVLVGVRGEFGPYLQYYVMTRVRGVCARLGLTNTNPTTLEFGPAVDLTSFGQAPSQDPFELLCDPGSAASGLSAAAGLYMDMLGVTCRPVTLSPGLDAVQLGADAAVPPF